MPWLSPSGSPGGSPQGRYSPTFGHSANNNNTRTSSNPQAPYPSVTYLPQLIDGACGTMPHAQRSVAQRLRTDLASTARLLPALVRAALVARVHTWDMVQHVGLALLEIAMLVSAVPLWLLCPGVVFLAWLGGCAVLVVAASCSLNGGRRATRGGPRIVRSPVPAADGDDERWFFVGGMGMSARSLSQATLPALAQRFRRPIESVHTPTYGLPVDFLALLLRRCLGAGFPPAAHARALYAQVRAAVLDEGTARTVVLAHNAGAVAVSQVLHQLYADLSADRMTKLEVYTFGAAAADFSMPLSGIRSRSRGSGHKKQKPKRKAGGSVGSSGQHPSSYHRQEQQEQHHQVHAPDLAATRRGPHVEHFAFRNDPFARMGVLRSVHEDLEGRFCGSVFELDCPGAAHHGLPRQERQRQTKSSQQVMVSLSDYMTCLFPEDARQVHGGGGPSPTSSPAAASKCHSAASSISSTGTMASSSRSQRHRKRHHQQPGEMLEDDQQSRRRNNDSDDHHGSSILDTRMLVDRDLAEKREFAALAQHSASVRSKGGKKRLSWTGLGATVGAPANQGNMDGVAGLEMARKGCRDCQGHRGRDVSQLARYYFLGAWSDTAGDMNQVVGGEEEEEEEKYAEEMKRRGGQEVQEMVLEDVISLIKIAAAQAPVVQVLKEGGTRWKV